MLRSSHGGDVYSQSYRLDFSANVNPYGMPSVVKRGLSSSIDVCECYPDIESQELRAQIGVKYDIPYENIICSNGASELIYRFVQNIMPKKPLICAPTFSEYENALRAYGCEPIYYQIPEEKDFQMKEDLGNFLYKVDLCDMVWICNPNNPTGESLGRYYMERILDKCIKKDIYIIVDESFADFVTEDISIRDHIFDYNKLIILNAFTKSYALAGLRLGFAFCGDTKFLNKLNSTWQPWSVSTMAQKAGMLALSDELYMEKTKRLIKIERKYMLDEMYNMGIKVFHTDTNFIFFKEHEGFADELKLEGFLIRDCSNYRGLRKGYYRICVRLHDQNTMLLEAMRSVRQRFLCLEQ